MKLRANRPGRDTRDIRMLLSVCEIATLDEAEDFYEEFYPGDRLDPRAVTIVSAILARVPSRHPGRRGRSTSEAAPTGRRASAHTSPTLGERPGQLLPSRSLAVASGLRGSRVLPHHSAETAFDSGSIGRGFKSLRAHQNRDFDISVGVSIFVCSGGHGAPRGWPPLSSPDRCAAAGRRLSRGVKLPSRAPPETPLLEQTPLMHRPIAARARPNSLDRDALVPRYRMPRTKQHRGAMPQHPEIPRFRLMSFRRAKLQI